MRIKQVIAVRKDLKMRRGKECAQAAHASMAAIISTEGNKHIIKQHDIYIRPSVYEKDNRLDFNNKVLLPGSCITTLESYTNCHIMREDPFEKYSLPVQQEFVNIHYIKHSGNKNITNGVFRSAFGKKGGGIKLNFKDSGKLLIKEDEAIEKTRLGNEII